TLAADTTHARVGCLVFYVGYRNPGLLAKAAVTIDHISGGRFELGLGAGWHRWEAEAFGYDFPAPGTRLDMLDEAAGLIRRLLTEERTTHEGVHFRASNAAVVPGPVDGRLPIWIGGTGEKRTLRIAARHADGWNGSYVSASELRRLNGVLPLPALERPRRPRTRRRRAADRDRCHRREADAADRRPPRRRLERLVRLGLRAAPPQRRARPALRGARARPVRDRAVDQRDV